MKIAHLFIFILIGLCLCFHSCKVDDPNAIEYAITFDSLDRSYILYNPSPDQSNLPLVFVLHGYGGNKEDVMTYTRMNEVAKEHNFAVCYPQGSADYNGFIHWNCLLDLGDAADALFLEHLARQLTDQTQYDPARTYLCGHSNGGFMAYHLARRDKGIFKAYASVCGTISGADWDSLSSPIRPDFLQISGTADDVIPMNGDIQLFGSWAGAPPIDSIYESFSQWANCSVTNTLQHNTNTIEYVYRSCQDQQQYQLTVLSDWGHGWPLNTSNDKDIHASQYIWQFFNN